MSWLGRLRQRFLSRRFRVLPFRYERFGGIAQLRWPRALVFVDCDRARALGYNQPPQDLWRTVGQKPEEDALDSLLTAPLEAHLQLTNRCAVGCQGCYTGATAEGAPHEWGFDEWRHAIDQLAKAGVFHVALGGGESALLPWLGDLLRHCRALGVVPNLTTSGLYDAEVLDRVCGWAKDGLFGQINLSLDGIGPGYQRVRGVDGFDQADQALVALRRQTPDVGINCVVTSQNFADLDAIFAHARHRRLNEIELLRFKPSGRGARAAIYQRLRCTDQQHREFLPRVLSLSRQHRMRVRLDCSYTPMVAHHRPDPRLLRWLAIYGCAGGDLLIAAKATGALAPCSFAPPVNVTVDCTASYWNEATAFPPFRGWRDAQEPCRSCDYLKLCRGGCRVVSAHVAGNASDPDPECPRVIAYRQASGTPAGFGQRTKRLPVIE